MTCPYQNICGGCPLRSLAPEEYRQHKITRFNQLIATLSPTTNIGTPVFIADGCRRRAELTFQFKKGRLQLGFNAKQSHEIVDIVTCSALTAEINRVLPLVRQFLQSFCRIQSTEKIKNKLQTKSITHGEIWLTQAANGIDILLESEEKLSLAHRMEISAFAADEPAIIRFSFGAKNTLPETILEKNKPYIDISGRRVFIPAGTFLQASQEGQNALISAVIKYVGECSGKIADLFCGVGTFSYPLSLNINNKITAVDSSAELLNSFRQTVNYLTIPNIKIVQKNLFKYPLDSVELQEFDIIIFDPPRAGASAQVAQIAAMKEADKPQKVVAVSCNPHTFINDAATLLHSGYQLEETTMVDQFVYAEHFELVALFVKHKGEKQ